MHESKQCEFGMVPITYRGHTYCSFACHRQQENYEVRIVKQHKTNKQYQIEYKNGEKAWVFKKTVEGYAQYAILLAKWRMAHPLEEITSVSNTVMYDDVIILGSRIANTDYKDEFSENKDKCCVCHEPLTADNWHICFGCKRPMHGKIICPKGELVFYNDDNDKLYCSECNLHFFDNNF